MIKMILSVALERFPTAVQELAGTVGKCSVYGVAQPVVSLLPVQATQEELLTLERFGLNATRAGRKGDTKVVVISAPMERSLHTST